jgi:magnesium and cobalt transporter
VVHRFGHLPRRGERIVIDNYLFKILRADNRRVHMLQLTVLPKASKDDGAGIGAATVTGNGRSAAS